VPIEKGILKINTWIFPSAEPEKSISPSESDARAATFVLAPLPTLMEPTRASLSFNHTSITPHLVPVNTKSLVEAMQWISIPVVKDPIAVFVANENAFNAVHDNKVSMWW